MERPASVGSTSISLTERPREVFVFDETQQPLSENIFEFFTFLRRGGRWITAEGCREGCARRSISLRTI